ncbi:MAG TPA: HD domain-containing phosphohydrolase [bacterium]|nr:HD domain-containing phosphohydrolase [bacterium]
MDETRGPRSAPRAAPRPLRVLIVEDEPPHAELEIEALRRAGFAPSWILVGSEAAYLAALSPALDLILVDNSLPQFSALRAAELLRQRGFDVPLIVVSGTIGEEAAVALMKQGVADYLLKDRLGRLGTAVDRTLEARRLRREKDRADNEQRERIERLEAVRDIDRAISSSFDLHTIFNVVLEKVTARLGVDAAAILLAGPAAPMLSHAASRGFRIEPGRPAERRFGEGHAGRAALDRRPVYIPDLAASPGEFAGTQVLAEGFAAYHAVPLVAKGRVVGVLELFHRRVRVDDQEWLSFLEALAAQAAIAIDITAMFANLERTNMDLARAYDTTLEGWSRALDLRDRETEGHSERVTRLTLRMARAMNLPDAELVHVRRGALLHDIGKMGIPDHILLKSGPLSPEERDLMRRHPVFAHDLLAPIAYLQPALDIPYCHHERWDGTGYPRGLKGTQIPLVARIFALADVWDAIRSDRPYRAAVSRDEALAYIRSQSGKHFDPEITALFLRLVDEQPD